MNDWKDSALIDVLDALIDYRGKTPNKTDFGIPLITAKIVKDGSIFHYTEFIAESDYDSWMVRGIPQKGDLVLTTEAPLGEVALLNGDKVALAQRIVTLRGKENILDTTYLKYFLQSDKGQLRLQQRATGSTVLGIKQSELRKVVISYPDYSEQKKIAAILSSFDEKIETNRKINARLEELAQALFKSWFIDFEPFGGKMPEDWKAGVLSDMVDSLIGGDWGKEEEDGNYIRKVLCIRGADLNDITKGEKGKSPTRYILEKNFKQKALSNHDIIVEISGGSPTQSTGRIAMLSSILSNECDDAIICTNFCKALKIKEPYSHYFYYLWNYLYDHKIMFIYENGSNGLKNLNLKNLLEREKCHIPGEKIAFDFSKIIEPIFQKIQRMGLESARLSELRDALLPKLMSGELMPE